MRLIILKIKTKLQQKVICLKQKKVPLADAGFRINSYRPNADQSDTTITVADLYGLVKNCMPHPRRNQPPVLRRPRRSPHQSPTKQKHRRSGRRTAFFKTGQVDRKTAFEVTSIHSRKDVLPCLQKLSAGSVVYVQNKKEFNEIVKASQVQSPEPDFNIEFVDNISLFDTDVNSQFSKKLSSYTADYVSRLQQENEDLQAAVEAAKAELKETIGLTITDKELRKFSNFFADTLQSDLTRDDLFKALRGYFNYAADGGDLNVVLGTMTDLYPEAMQTSKSEMLSISFLQNRETAMAIFVIRAIIEKKASERRLT